MSKFDALADQPLDLTRRELRAATQRAYDLGFRQARAGRIRRGLLAVTAGACLALVAVAAAGVFA